MEYRYKPEDVPNYQRWQKRVERFAETFPAEVFKWFGWVSAIAAVHVVDERLESSWLQVLAVVLSLLLVMRIQWFLGIKHPETLEPDGSLLVRFRPWKILISIPATAFAYFLAFYMASLIVKSELLPPSPQLKAAPAETPKPITVAPQLPTAVPKVKPAEAPKRPSTGPG